MKMGLLSRFLSPKFLLPGGGAVFTMAVLLVCRAIGLSWTVTSILMLVSVLVFLVGLTVSLFVAQKRQRDFVDGMEKQVEDDYRMASVSKRQAIRELQQKWKESINNIKTSGLGHHSDPLYALPWFAIIGEPQSGKSTAIKNSGVEFPMGDSVQGMGGTKNCDWWFSNRFILLDTAGRYTFDEGKETVRAEWLAFLKLLAKYRKRMPINGVILAVPVDSLMNRTPDQLRLEARNARQKIDQISQELGLYFPVFLLIMKSDLINGFTEFFQALPEDKLDEVLGWTNDQRSLDDPISTFDKAFDEIHTVIRKLRLSLLKDETRKENLQTIYFFPEEFRRLKSRLSIYIDLVFKSNPYYPAPFLRGFYFSSGTQVGTVISSLIQALGLKSKLKTFDASYEARTYFLRDFFLSIMVRDQNLAVLSKKKVVSEKRKRWSVFSLAGILFALLIVLYTFSFGKSLSEGYRVRKAIEETLKIPQMRVTASPEVSQHSQALQLQIPQMQVQHLEAVPQYSKALDRIGAYVEELEAVGKSHFWSGWGLYTAGQYFDPLRNFFLTKYDQKCLKPAIDHLLRSIHSYADSKKLDEVEAFFSDLTLYGKYLNVMKTPPAIRSHEHKESQGGPLLSNNDFDLLVKPLGGESEKDSLRFKDNFHRYLLWSDTFTLNKEYEARKLAMQPDLITAAFPPEIILNYLSKLNYPPIDPTPKYLEMASLPKAHAQVDGIYSKAIWNERVYPILRYFFMASKDQNLPAEVRSGIVEEILVPVLSLYGPSYEGAWSHFLSSNTVQSAGRGRLADREFAEWALTLGCLDPIDHVAENTRLELDTTQMAFLKDFGEELAAFNIIHEFKKEEVEQEYEGLVKEAFEKWRIVVLNPNQEHRSEQIRELLFPSKDQDPLSNPFRKVEIWIDKFFENKESGPVAEQLQRSLRLPLEAARLSLLEDFRAYINREWHQEVYSYFRRNFQNKFPFVSKAQIEASRALDDVDTDGLARFFRRDTGKLFSFVRNNLSLFIEQGKKGFRQTNIEKYPVKVDPSCLRFLTEAFAVSRFFLDDQGEFRRLGFVLETRSMPADPMGSIRKEDIYVIESRFRIEDRQNDCILVNRQGPRKQENCRWSLKESERAYLAATIEVFDRSETLSLDFAGKWSVLRLLLHGRMGRDVIEWVFEVSEPNTKRTIARARVPYFVRFSDSDANPFRVPFSSIRCPEAVF